MHTRPNPVPVLLDNRKPPIDHNSLGVQPERVMQAVGGLGGLLGLGPAPAWC